MTEAEFRERLALYNSQQPVMERAKERYDKRQRMLNDPAAQEDYRVQQWGNMGKLHKSRQPASDPIQKIEEPAELAALLRGTFSPERATEIDEGMDQEYAGYVQEQEVTEFLIRRANIGRAAFEQHKLLNPEASDSDAYNKMYQTLTQYGFQPRGLEKLIPFVAQDGRVAQADYAPVWSEARSLLLGVIRGARRLATSPPELVNAGLEMLSDLYNRNQAGVQVTGSNIFRDARRNFAIQMGAVDQILTPDDIPYNFDVAGIMGEQIPNIVATMSGAGLISKGSKLAGNALALGSMFAAEGTDAYNNYMQYGEQQGLDPRIITTQAYAGAIAYGAASAALERLIPVETFKRIPGFKNRVAAWSMGALAEGSTEFLQSLTQAGIGDVIDLGQFDWDSIRQAVREAAAGAIVGGVAGAATIGRATPQVDRLEETLGLDEIKAEIVTELDTLKSRNTIANEIDVVSEWQMIPTPQPEGTVQNATEAIDRAVVETTNTRSKLQKLRKAWRSLVGMPARLAERIPDQNPIGQLRDTIGRGLSDIYKKPAEWIEGRRAAKGRERLTAHRADLMGALWTKELKAAGLDPESGELHAIAQMVLEGRAKMEILPPAMRAWVETARTMQDAESMYAARIYRAAGMDELAAKFEKNIGSYLKRIPLVEVQTLGKARQVVRKALKLKTSAAFGKRRRDKWRVRDGKKLVGEFETESEARETYSQAIAERKRGVIKKRAAKRGVSVEDINRQAAKNVTIEEPIPQEWWDQFGVHDPRFLLALSMVEARHDAEMVQLFHKTAQRWGQEAPEGMTGKGLDGWAKKNGLVQLPQSARLHNLSGVFVPEAIASDLNEMTQLPSDAKRAYQMYLGAWKSSKTLWNPATHARNVYGNVLVFSYLARVSALNPLNAKFYRQAVASLAAKDDAFLALLENGALGGEYYGGEIKKIEKALKSAEDTAIGEILAVVGTVQSKLGEIYAMEDQVFKLAAYHKYKKEGMSTEEAAEEVNKWFPNYERTGKVTRWLRNSPIGAPFISFVDQSVRIAGRGFAERPLRVAAIAAMPGIINYISMIAIGLNPDEKELIDANHGYLEPLMPWRDDKGRVQTVDLRYILPLANDIIPETRRGSLMIPWMFSGPAATAAIEQFSGKERFTGKEFIREGMTTMEQVQARLATVIRAAVPHPSFIYWGTKRVIGSITGDRDEHTANAIVGSLMGLNVRSPYIAEKHVKQVVQNMIADDDWREAKVLLDVWNGQYKPDHLKNLTIEGMARGLRQRGLAKWRKVRDNAAEALLQDRGDDAQEIIEDYMAELDPRDRKLFMPAVEYRARQLRIQGKTR